MTTAAPSETPTASEELGSLSESAKAKIQDYVNKNYANVETSALDYTAVGADYVLAEVPLGENANQFLLYHETAGTFESLPVQNADLRSAVNENYFVFEENGYALDSSLRSVPCLEYCFRIGSDSGTQNFQTVEQQEVFDLTRSVQAGSKDDELLSDLIPTVSGLEMVYRPADGDTQFYADTTDIPATITSYDADTRQFTVTISTDQLGGELQYGTTYTPADNFYITSYQLPYFTLTFCQSPDDIPGS